MGGGGGCQTRNGECVREIEREREREREREKRERERERESESMSRKGVLLSTTSSLDMPISFFISRLRTSLYLYHE